MPDLPVVGKVPKGWLIAVGGGSLVVIGYLYYRHKQGAGASATTAATTPAGTAGDQYPPDGTYGNPSDPYSTDPDTGMTYGDEQLYGGGSGGFGTAGFFPGAGLGQGSTGTTGTTQGPGSFTTNADWAQYAEQQLAGVVDPTALSASLGVYLTGRAASSEQESLIDQAIAVAGYPPVDGPGNFPPNIKQSPGGPGGGKVTVPNVVTMEVDAAQRVLTGAGLKYSRGPLKPGHGYTVTAESPKAGTKVSSGSTIHLTIKEKN